MRLKDNVVFNLKNRGGNMFCCNARYSAILLLTFISGGVIHNYKYVPDRIIQDRGLDLIFCHGTEAQEKYIAPCNAVTYQG